MLKLMLPLPAMEKYYRISLPKLAIMIQLVIALSLAIFPISMSEATMHGTPATGVSVARMQENHPQAHQHKTSNADVKAKCVVKSSDASGCNDSAGTGKPGCCKNFCSGFALLYDPVELASFPVSSVRLFGPHDQLAPGELPSLHRPPSI